MVFNQCIFFLLILSGFVSWIRAVYHYARCVRLRRVEVPWFVAASVLHLLLCPSLYTLEAQNVRLEFLRCLALFVVFSAVAAAFGIITGVVH